jgi:hypothetical protein
LERRLRQAEGQAEQLLVANRQKDEELERVMQQKVALTSIFESDLLGMTEKMIAAQSAAQGRGQTQHQQHSSVNVQDLMNLQKLIAVSFQAIKSSMQGGVFNKP